MTTRTVGVASAASPIAISVRRSRKISRISLRKTIARVFISVPLPKPGARRSRRRLQRPSRMRTAPGRPGREDARSFGSGTLLDQLQECVFQVPMRTLYLRGRAGRDHGAFVEDRYAVAQPLRIVKDVRGEDDALAAVPRLDHEVADLARRQNVEVGRRPVSYTHLT